MSSNATQNAAITNTTTNNVTMRQRWRTHS